MSNSTKLVRLCAMLALLLGLSSSAALAQDVYYTAPDADGDCLTDATPGEFGECLDLINDGDNADSDVLVVAGGTYEEDEDFEEIVITNNVTFLPWDGEAGGDVGAAIDGTVTARFVGERFSFVLGDISVTQAGATLNEAATLALGDNLNLDVAVPPGGNNGYFFADGSAIAGSQPPIGGDVDTNPVTSGRFIISGDGNIEVQVAEPDPASETPAIPNIFITNLVIDRDGEVIFEELQRFANVQDPQLRIDQALLIEDGELLSPDGVLFLNFDAENETFDDDGNLEPVLVIEEGSLIDVDDLLVDVNDTDLLTGDTLFFAGEGSLIANNVELNSEVGLLVVNFSEIQGNIAVELEDDEADLTFTNLTTIDGTAFFDGAGVAIDGDVVDDDDESQITFLNAVTAMGEVTLNDVALLLSANAVPNGVVGDSEFEDNLILGANEDPDGNAIPQGGVRIVLGYDANGSNPDSYHNLSVLADVTVNAESAVYSEAIGTLFVDYLENDILPPNVNDLFADLDIVGNALFFEGGSDTELNLAADLNVGYLVIDKGDDGDEVEIDAASTGDLVISSDYILYEDRLSVLDLDEDGVLEQDERDAADLEGVLVALEGEFTTNANLDATGALVVLDEGAELDRGANETVFTSDDSVPTTIIYTGTDFTRISGDELEQIEELEALGVAIEGGELVLDEDITLLERLILAEGTLDLETEDAELSFEIAETDDVTDAFTVIVENGEILGDDDNIVYPSEYSDEFEDGLDGLVLVYVGDEDRDVTAEFPNDRENEVLLLAKTGEATLTFMEGEEYQVTGAIRLFDGLVDLNGATLDLVGFDNIFETGGIAEGFGAQFDPIFFGANPDSIDAILRTVEVFVDSDANFVAPTATDTVGAGTLRFIGEGNITVLVDDTAENNTAAAGTPRGDAFFFPNTVVDLALNDNGETNDANDWVHFSAQDTDGLGTPDLTFASLAVLSADEVDGVAFTNLINDVAVLGDYSQQVADVIFANDDDITVDGDVMVMGGGLFVRNGDPTLVNTNLFTVGGMYMQTGGNVDFADSGINAFPFEGGSLETFSIAGNFEQTAGSFEFYYPVFDVNSTEGVSETDTTGYNFTVTEDADFYISDGTSLFVDGDFNFTGSSDVDGNGALNEGNAFDGTVLFTGAAQQFVNVTTTATTDQFENSVVRAAQFDGVVLSGDGGVLLLSDIAIDTDGFLTLQNGIVETQAGVYDVYILNTSTESLVTFAGGVVGQRNNPENVPGNIVRLGSRDSFVDGTVTRRIVGDQATGGVVNEGYFFPVGLETMEQRLFAPLLLQFGTEGRTTTAQVTTFGPEAADADVQNAIQAFAPFAVSETEMGDDDLVLNTLGDLFYKVEFDEVPSTDPNIRIIADFIERGVINEVRALRIVQLPCADGPQFAPRLAGVYDLTPSDPDDASFGLNDFINGVANVVQEGVAVQECQIFAVATDQFRNPIQGGQAADFATVQLIHASPDVPEVDVYVNGFQATSLDYLEATPFSRFPLDAVVAVYLADADTAGTDPLFTTTLDVVDEGTYVLAVAGTAEEGDDTITLQVIAKENARTDAIGDNTVDFFFMHAVPGAPVVDVVSLDLNNQADDIFANNLAYGDTSPYEVVEPTTYTLAVRTQDFAIVEAVEVGLGTYQGEALTFVIAPSETASGIQVVGFDADGDRINLQVVTDTEGPGELPVEFALDGNYPNPFNPSTSIQFDLPQTAEVTIEVVDMLGRRVMMLPATTMQAGANQQVRLDAQSLSSGSYIYRVVAKSGDNVHVATGRMTLIK